MVKRRITKFFSIYKINIFCEFQNFYFRFSINFVIDSKAIPSYIPYQFKTHFDQPKNTAVRHNHKYNSWGNEDIDELTWIDAPGINHPIICYYYSNFY